MDKVVVAMKGYVYECIFFRITQYNADVHNTHAYSPILIHLCKLYLYKHLRRTEPTNLEIHEVTTDASLSTGTSPTTESIAPLNPEINPGNNKEPE
jgi:hypothetical protein